MGSYGLQKPVEEWPMCDCLISFHSKGFPLEKAIQYAVLRNPFIINNLDMQFDIQDRRRVYSILETEGIEIPRYAVLDRDSPDPKLRSLIRFLLAKHNKLIEIYRQLCEVYGNDVITEGGVHQWCIRFQNGQTNVHDDDVMMKRTAKHCDR
ncbi:Inositol hexakisphosphate and diphosphoinositol-pentakisphosphate kinase 2 [Homalodisca vitripennis]|nr:Inositol hexakisphosphate and diphosphoinositol-pentakisphosphate kinase 2 [Homalodisca vitripennis]